MEMLKKFMLLMIVVLLNACSSKKEETKIALFFNPSHVFYINEQSIYAKLGETIVVDTIVESTSVDKSVLLKCFKISDKNQNDLYIRVNSKDTLLHLNGQEKCSSIFVSYDDHTNESRQRVLDDVGRAANDSTGSSLIDSLSREALKGEFLEVVVKQDSCWCNE